MKNGWKQYPCKFQDQVHKNKLILPEKFYDSISTGREFLQHNRFGSFAPERTNQVGQFFIDGQNYMSAVADAILAATEEIYIADWWLSPEIYLKRGLEFDEKFRLDRLLKKKAVSGKSMKGFFFSKFYFSFRMKE